MIKQTLLLLLAAKRESWSITAAALALEVPLVQRRGAEGLLVLAEEKGKTVGRRYECVDAGTTQAGVGKVAHALDHRFGQHARMPATPHRLLRRSTLQAAMQDAANGHRAVRDELL